MSQFVSWVAPRTGMDFAVKVVIAVVLGNLLAMAVVYAVHGYFPSGLSGQLIETTVIGAPFIFGSLKIIAYLYDLQERLAKLAATDALTGLRNRRAFLEEVAALQGVGQAGHLFLADADHFKRINDTYGHDVGDACLCALARHMEEICAPQDVVARIGGEEFAVFRPAPSHPDPETFGAALCRPFPAGPSVGVHRSADLILSLSAGCVAAPANAALKTLLAEADRLLYCAKALGRRRCAFADTPLPGERLDPVA